MNKTCLSYWFPIIRDAGIPIPKTEIVTMEEGVSIAIFQVFDGQEMGAKAAPFFERLRCAVDSIGTPCFLRTGMTSGKHYWKTTCHLADASKLESHVLSLVEFSEIACIMGIDWRVWAVRELLPTRPLAVLPRYGDMPLCREFRCFVRDGEVECIHPYWPEQAIRDGFKEAPAGLEIILAAVTDCTQEESSVIEELAHRVGAVVSGYWSVDILDTQDGWYVTDMALGDESWHWPQCEMNKESELQP